jgi:hypothetical protein
MGRHSPSAALALAIGVLASAPTRAQGDPYDDLPFSAYEIYEAALHYASDSDFEQLAKSLKYFSSLVDAMGKSCGEDLGAQLRESIAKKDPVKARAALLKVIFSDMRRHLAAAARVSGDEREDQVQMAFTLYAFLSPEVVAKDKPRDEAVRAAFRQIHRAADAALIRERSEWIATQLSQVVPVCALAAK